jgi:hypothetical protein
MGEIGTGRAPLRAPRGDALRVGEVAAGRGDALAERDAKEKSFVVELPAEALQPAQIEAQVRAVLGVATAG